MSNILSITPAQALSNQLSTQSNNLMNLLQAEYNSWNTLLFNNNDQTNLAPAQAWAALGTNAASLNTLMGAMADFLNTNLPNGFALTAELYTVTNNADGTVAVASAAKI